MICGPFEAIIDEKILTVLIYCIYVHQPLDNFFCNPSAVVVVVLEVVVVDVGINSIFSNRILVAT